MEAVACKMCMCVCVCVSIKEVIACANMDVTTSNKPGSGGPRAVGWQESHTVIRFQLGQISAYNTYAVVYYMYIA